VFASHRRHHRWWCAVVGCAVIIGVLPGVGCPARRNILSALKIERKKLLTGGTGRCHLPVPPLVSSLVPPFPSLWRRLAAALVAVAALVLSWWWRSFPSLLHLMSPWYCRGSRSRSVCAVYL
jgi:hypothetical protein